MSLFELDETDTPTELAAHGAGMLGTRRLIAVQLLDVGRLQSEVLPLPEHGGLVAVTGRGPVDSNQSSKTTWEAAVDLLCMSHAWGPRSGRTGGFAEGLILSPDGMFRNYRASRAYLIGVFRDGKAPATGPLTVIAQIERNSDERLRFRVIDGQVFAVGATHEDRLADAAALWEESRRQPTYSAERYLREVLGGQPRSAGYVNRRGSLESPAVTLFTSELSKVDPERIATDLLQLTGLDEQIRNERLGRASAAGRRGDVVRAEKELEQTSTRYAEELDRIGRRASALQAASRAEAARSAWLAAATADAARTLVELAEQRGALEHSEQAATLRGELDGLRAEVSRLGDLDALQRDVAAAGATLDQLRPGWEDAQERERAAEGAVQRLEGRHDDEQLVELASQATGRARAAVAAEHDTAVERRDAARERLGAVRKVAEDAQRHLDTLTTTGSQLVALARDVGIDTVALGDSVEVADTHRTLWDPLLTVWQDALVVPPEQLDAALAALAAYPGTVVIADPPAGQLPEGVVSAPAAAEAALLSLGRGARTVGQHVVAASIPHHVVGGFDTPQIGREARIAAATTARDTTAEQLTQAEQTLKALQELAGELEQELRAADAAATREKIARDLSRAREQLGLRRREREALQPGWDRATQAAGDARAAVQHQAQQLEDAKRRLETHQETFDQQVARPAAALLTRARAIDIDRRLTAFRVLADVPLPDRIDPAEPDHDAVTQIAQAVEAYLAPARQLLGPDESRATNTWRHRSIDELDLALQELDVTTTLEDGRKRVVAPSTVPADIAQRYQRRLELLARQDQDDEDEQSPAARINLSFDELVRTVVDWLEPMVEQDEARARRLQDELEQHRREVESARDGFRSQQAAAETGTAAVSDLVQSRLERVSRAFSGRVAASGNDEQGELRIDRIDPESPDQELRWRVTPAWSRAPGDPPTPYRQGSPNTAQEKLKAIQLILAAFSSDGPPARVLLLDELAAGLGARNFADVIATLAETARAEGLTVLATIQDTHIDQVVDHAESVLFFRYRATSQLLNDPTAVMAKGPDGALTETGEQLVQSRPRGEWTPLGSGTEPAWDGTSPMVPDTPQTLFDRPPDTR